jgi:hypothetical protein
MATKQSRSRPKHRLHPSGKTTTVKASPVDKQAKREAAIAQEQFDQGRAYELHLATTKLAAAAGIGSGVEAAGFLGRLEHRR